MAHLLPCPCPSSPRHLRLRFVPFPLKAPHVCRSYRAHPPAKRRCSLSNPPPTMDLDFPFLSPPLRSLMSDLLSSLRPHLSLTPPSSLDFQNPSGSSLGALQVVSGAPSSPVDFVLQSWIHSQLPSGAALDISTISGFLKSTATDAPYLVLDFIQSGPTSMVLVADLLPRKDLVLHPDYLHRFYESTRLEKARQELAGCPQVRPYFSSSLYVRSALSPTAIAVVIDCGGAAEMEELVGLQVRSSLREVVGVWVESCVGDGRVLEEEEAELQVRRDSLVKKKAIEVELSASLPRLFGDDVAGIVVETIRKAYGV